MTGLDRTVPPAQLTPMSQSNSPPANGGAKNGVPFPVDRIDTWIFDLDNTLYPPTCRLFDQVDQRIGQFISRHLSLDPTEARALQKRYFREYGTSLRGLMTVHGMAPEPFLEFVHDIDVTPVPPSPALADGLAALPGRKLVFTNGTVSHAERVIDRLGVTGTFDAIFDIAASDYIPQPDPRPYQALLSDHAVEPTRAVMVEDIAKNLATAHGLGMTTVLLRSDSPFAGDGDAAPYVDYVIDDLAAWLAEIVPSG